MKAQAAMLLANSYTKESMEGGGAIKGDKGDKGNDGKSAYQVAISNGFVGTEAEWLETLQPEVDYDIVKEQVTEAIDNLATGGVVQFETDPIDFNNF